MNNESNKANDTKKSSGCVTAIIVLVVLAVIVLLGFKFVESQQSNSSSDSSSKVPQPSNGQGSSSSPSLLSRMANNNDILVDTELDLASFGFKCTVMPQCDIKGLVLTINFCDSNKNVLKTNQKSLGNVTEGVQVSFSISILDLGLSVSLKTEYALIAVSGGKVSYFQ